MTLEAADRVFSARRYAEALELLAQAKSALVAAGYNKSWPAALAEVDGEIARLTGRETA